MRFSFVCPNLGEDLCVGLPQGCWVAASGAARPAPQKTHRALAVLQPLGPAGLRSGWRGSVSLCWGSALGAVVAAGCQEGRWQLSVVVLYRLVFLLHAPGDVPP